MIVCSADLREQELERRREERRLALRPARARCLDCKYYVGFSGGVQVEHEGGVTTTERDHACNQYVVHTWDAVNGHTKTVILKSCKVRNEHGTCPDYSPRFGPRLWAWLVRLLGRL